jgi:predicted glycogen debranching enzyme
VLSNLVETINFSNQVASLQTLQFSSNVIKDGYDLMSSYRHLTHPVFMYVVNNLQVTKEILMPKGHNAVLIKYTFLAQSGEKKWPENITLHVSPLFAMRDFHELMIKNDDILSDVSSDGDRCCFKFHQPMLDVYLQSNQPLSINLNSSWYEHVKYAKEQERGYACEEDLLMPATVAIDTRTGSLLISFSLQPLEQDLHTLWTHELARRNAQLVVKNPLQDAIYGQSFLAYLSLAADQFLINDGRGESITAGYPWFLEWGRDAMISLPGLTLCRGMIDTCFNTLQHFAKHIRRGLLANFICNDDLKTQYNSVDASLWFVWAVQQYYLATGNKQQLKKYFWPVLCDIFHHYQQGTDYGIEQHDDGLIYCTDAKYNLSWMDAMVDDDVITPRIGAQVEVNALWYNMLCFMAEIAGVFTAPAAKELKSLAKKVRISYVSAFWQPKLGYLLDSVNADCQSSAIRPNQIFAVSLPYSPLNQQMQRCVVDTVKEHLLTPYGLRTLSPLDINYQGSYGGGVQQRDRAYHNGTIWPWLIGAFGEAILKTYPDRHMAIKILEPCLKGLESHFFKAGALGSLSEVFSGDFPHQPDGCVAQAWSVAELIRLIYLLNQPRQG